MEKVYLAVVLAPLIASIIAGLFGRQIGRSGAHWVTIIGVAIALAASVYAFYMHVFGGLGTFDGTVYTWIASDLFEFNIGFLVDNLTVMMMVVVTAVSLMVHIYTIGYMHDDPGYQRFFSYISLFTFSMLMLVMSNNLLQLFFGWEAVGLVSYLLIGFWYKRESAIFANLKAFLVNRVGDFGFLLGIAAILAYTDSLHYATVFERLPELADITVEYWPGVEWSLISVIAILLFIGAMGKSAQVPLHVWLPDSMEGPTPISALIHAATMVTAGIFMVARFSPLFELSDAALSFILVIGAVTAIFMGLLGIVQHDIKRVIAYSTLSQLGFMTAALGVSAYSPALFHLMTHAFFKALLFLAAGSVIIALHHEQDMRKMGGLAKKLPITFATFFIGALALIGFPGTSGFYSKESIIYAVAASELPGAEFAYWALFIGVFVTAFYTFRMLFLVFFGESRMDAHTASHAKESPKVVTVPLVLLAVPSLIIGFLVVEPMLFGAYFDDSIRVLATHGAMATLEDQFKGAWGMFLYGWTTPVVWMALAGVAGAAIMYLGMPNVLPPLFARVFAWPKRILEEGYGFDSFNNTVIAGGSRLLGRGLWQGADLRAIDGWLVNGTAAFVGYMARTWRLIQTGYLYHYAFVMILGLIGLMTWIVFIGA
ncbi:NADH-quinone oxidoreductase subunit L [Guyparkeria sp. TX1]|uniref:NADH-quinone oxidoreductase subunit L n=1 Tax=Guyparkeria sp. TX1 TaxID=3115001 RepID=UPI00397729B9